jgi:arylsulfatase A-like enzyme
MKNLLLILIILCIGMGFAKVTKPSIKEKKLNILYIMADDLTMQAISAYGDIYKEIAPTPNIDRLAKEGMLFENVMCTNAICGPSRACILTGNYGHINGYTKNEKGGQFDSTQWTFPQAFQQNGYHTALYGKWHLGSAPIGFDDYMYHVTAGQQGVYWNPIYNMNGIDKKVEGYDTNITGEAAINFLQNKLPKGKPFMMMVQFKSPHRPWDPDEKYEHLWDEIEMPYPSNFNDKYAGREATAGNTEMTMDYFCRRDMKLPAPENLTPTEKYKWETYGQKKGELVQPEGMTYEEGRKWRYQTYIKDYLACVKSIDDNVGKILDYLKASQLDQNTVVILTSDQGFYLGEHGFFDKRFIYDESLKMPFLMKYPGKIKPGSINKDIISNIDFAPTFLDIANIQTTQKMQGKSFVQLLQDKRKGWRQSMYYHYYEYPHWHHVQPHYGIRTDRYTLAHFYYNIDKWELYDNSKDPQQMNNIINDPNYTKVIKKLKRDITVLQKQYKDDKGLAAYRMETDKDYGIINSR